MKSKQPPPGPSPFDAAAFDYTNLPDYDIQYITEEDLTAFAQALAAPDANTNNNDSPTTPSRSLFITALNDWAPIRQRVRKAGKKIKKIPRRTKDESREGYVYNLLKWPLLALVLSWLFVLSVLYLLTRFYIFLYEHFVTIRGRRKQIRREMRSTATYEEWVEAAQEMDRYLGNDKWRKIDQYAYYNSGTLRRVKDELRDLRVALETGRSTPEDKKSTAEDLRVLLEASVKNNFVGFEHSRLYSETFYGTKDLVQEFVEEVERSLQALSDTSHLSQDDKTSTFSHIYRNYGRTALCLSGGATFAYYHFGVAKALVDANALPDIISGTSGGALVAALLCTRTDAELKHLLVPALAYRIRAASDPITKWLPRWYRTGARFDSLEWARNCSWFTHGSLTFAEAYARTGRILNVTCIPSDPHSPTVLANYLTAPDCVIWSAVLASAAVPGILNPVVLMRKNRSTGQLEPYSFGAKWKDGSLRTDVPLKALNTYFNVTFSIVSQVNPHINLFFFSSRGTAGEPVTHRRGRGWRGGFLGSAVEQYLKLDLTKWLKVLRALELLPRFVGQDWSEIWLQRFSGTVTVWPRVSWPADFVHILSDPPPERLARMIWGGLQSAFPKILFVRNRLRVERMIEEGLRKTKGEKDGGAARFEAGDVLLHGIGNGTTGEQRQENRDTPTPHHLTPPSAQKQTPILSRTSSPSLAHRITRNWFSPSNSSSNLAAAQRPAEQAHLRRGSSVMQELSRQSRVLFDGSDGDDIGSCEGGDDDCEEEDDDEDDDDDDNEAGRVDSDDGQGVSQNDEQGVSQSDPLLEMAKQEQEAMHKLRKQR